MSFHEEPHIHFKPLQNKYNFVFPHRVKGHIRGNTTQLTTPCG